MFIISDLKQQSRELGIPIWKLPDFILIILALVTIFIMIFSYVWTSSEFFTDPREAVLLVAAEAAIFLGISNMVVELAKKFIQVSIMKKEFINIISHQMRTPLTTIRWSAEMLGENQEKPLDESQKKFLGRIVNSNEELNAFVDDLLHITIAERSEEKCKIKKIDMKKIIEDSINRFSSLTRARNIKIEIPQDEKPGLVLADELKIRIVMDNLLNNALKYSQVGGSIKISLKKNDGQIVCGIKDGGIGISEQERLYIFDKFYRSREAKQMYTEGTGLGLFICKMLLERMKGKIWLTSKVGKGSTFFFSLPAAGA